MVSKVWKKNLWSKNFVNPDLRKIRSTNFIFSIILNYFHHFQTFLLYKNDAYLKELIRRNFEQCGMIDDTDYHLGNSLCTNLYRSTI